MSDPFLAITRIAQDQRSESLGACLNLRTQTPEAWDPRGPCATLARKSQTLLNTFGVAGLIVADLESQTLTYCRRPRCRGASTMELELVGMAGMRYAYQPDDPAPPLPRLSRFGG